MRTAAELSQLFPLQLIDKSIKFVETFILKSIFTLLSKTSEKNRWAPHPINALLSYAYAVRQTQLQIDAVAEGYDPTIGIMRYRHQKSAAFILDLIESERPKVDAKILDLIRRRSFSAADFVLCSDGVCRLSP